MKNKKTFKVYYLRRQDKTDPFNSELWQPFYAGKGRGDREKSHRKEALKLLENPNAKNSNPIRNSIIHKLWKQGLDFIEDIIHIQLTNEEACELEIESIAKYGRIDLGTGCLSNCTFGGEGSCGRIYIVSEETRKRISENHADFSGENHPLWGTKRSEESKQKQRDNHADQSGENNPNWGKVASEETRKKQSIAHTGKKIHTEEYKKELSERMSGENHPMYGKHHTKESNQKNRESKTGQVHKEESKQKIKEGADKLWIERREDPVYMEAFSRKMSLVRTKNRRLKMLQDLLQDLLQFLIQQKTDSNYR